MSNDEIVELFAKGFDEAEQKRVAAEKKRVEAAQTQYDPADDELSLHMRLVRGFEKRENWL